MHNLTQVPTKRGTELATLVELRDRYETFLIPRDDMDRDTFKKINAQGNIPRRINGIDCTVFVDWAPCPVPNYSVRYMINIPAVRRTFQVESIKTWTEYVTRWKAYFLPSAVLKRGQHVISPFCSSVKYLEIETAAKNEKRLWDLTHLL